MTEGPIGREIVRFALPLFLGNLFQQLYNTADALIVGNLLGDQALAAVSSSGSLMFLITGFFMGLFMGAGVVISRFFGARATERMRLALHTTLLGSVLCGLLLMLLGTVLAPGLLRWMETPSAVMGDAVLYTRIYFLGGIGLTLFNACMGVMQAVGDSRHPLYYLMFSSVLNVLLDIWMIRGLGMGVDGAALATILAQFLSAGLCMRRLMRTRDSHRVVWRELRLDKASLRLIVRYGIPSALQNSVIAFANVVVQSYINAFGDLAMAGCGAYSKLEGFAFIPVTSFTAAITTFVGQNLGAEEYDRARRGARFGILCSAAIAEGIGLAFYLAAPALIGAFTRNAVSIAFGVQKARTCALFYCLLAASHCFAAVLRGAGRAKVPMFVMLGFWCVFRVLFLMVTVPRLGTIAVVNWVYPLTWALSTAALALYYFKSSWSYGFQDEKRVPAAGD